ncbi:hypothetical protein DERA104750_03480 [Deinococcus radiodurans]|nr:hypothetical protein DRO_A0002 [Deinococcus radiodurans R1 = ATCC 13939 = DSM 20539]
MLVAWDGSQQLHQALARFFPFQTQRQRYQLKFPVHLINDIQVVALQVFNEGSSSGLLVAELPNDDRNFSQASQLGGSPTTLPCNNLVLPIHRTHQQRLQYPMRPDTFCQLT